MPEEQIPIYVKIREEQLQYLNKIQQPIKYRPPASNVLFASEFKGSIRAAMAKWRMMSDEEKQVSLVCMTHAYVSSLIGT